MDAGASASAEAVRRRRRTRLRRLLALSISVAATVAVVAARRSGWVPTQPAAGEVALGAGAALALVLVWPDRSGRWSAGAAGERATARALAGAEDDGYVILHDQRLPGQRWNLDHLLIGPPGVVVIETKQWAVPVRVARRRRPAVLRHYEWQVEAVERVLGPAQVPVRQFLCVHGAKVQRRWWARGAPVGDGAHLRRWMRRLPRRLSASEVENLALVARRTFVSDATGERHTHARTAGPDRALVERSSEW